MPLSLDLYEKPINYFPSAGMVELTGIPDKLLYTIRRELTFANPQYTRALAAKEDVTNISPHILGYRETDTSFFIPRYYWHEELFNYGLKYLVPPDAGHFEFKLQTQPRPNQYAVVQFLESCTWDVGLELPCGFGKALANHEPILTWDGEKPIGEARVGDLIAGTDGHFHKITAVHPQGERELYRVTFTDGTHVDCDGDHLWTLEQRREKGRPKVTLRLRDLLTKSLRGAAGRKYYLPDVSPINFVSYQSKMPIDPYTLGVLLGDGYMAGGVVTLTTADIEILSLMKLPRAHRFMSMNTSETDGRANGTGCAETYRISMNRSDAQKLSMKSLSIWSMLESLELADCRAHQKFIPKQYKLASAKDRLNLLRGLFDTDGAKSGGFCVEYSTVSKQLAEDVKWIVSSLGGWSTLAQRKTRYTKKDGQKSRWFDSYRLNVKLPIEMNPFRLSRHSIPYAAIKRQREPARAIDRIEKVGTAPATCISVASPDRLFLTRNCVPTHNSSLALRYASKFGGRILVVAPTNVKLNEWFGEVEKHLGIPRKGCGHVQAAVRKWKEYPVVVTMLKTLATQEFEPEFLNGFAAVIWDEHHLSAAPLMSRALGKVNGVQIALTATPGSGVRRQLMELHGGSNWVTQKSQGKPVTAHFIRVKAPRQCYYYDSSTGRPAEKSWRVQKMVIAGDKKYSWTAASFVKDALAQGRRVLVLNSQIDPLIHLYKSDLPNAGFVIGSSSIKFITEQVDPLLGQKIAALPGTSIPKKTALYIENVKKTCNPILGTGLTKTQPAGMGMDVDDLDGGVVMFPVADEDMTRQLIGRWERAHATKQNPSLVIMYPDTPSGIAIAKKMAWKMRTIGVNVVEYDKTV